MPAKNNKVERRYADKRNPDMYLPTKHFELKKGEERAIYNKKQVTDVEQYVFAHAPKSELANCNLL